jgi:hypothetical protein
VRAERPAVGGARVCSAPRKAGLRFRRRLNSLCVAWAFPAHLSRTQGEKGKPGEDEGRRGVGDSPARSPRVRRAGLSGEPACGRERVSAHVTSGAFPRLRASLALLRYFLAPVTTRGEPHAARPCVRQTSSAPKLADVRTHGRTDAPAHPQGPPSSGHSPLRAESPVRLPGLHLTYRPGWSGWCLGSWAKPHPHPRQSRTLYSWRMEGCREPGERDATLRGTGNEMRPKERSGSFLSMLRGFELKASHFRGRKYCTA